MRYDNEFYDYVKEKAESNYNKKKLKGYQYDSLVYRYIRAREAMAELEWSRDHKLEKSQYYDVAKRDILRFCEILDEAIGEHE